MREDGARDALYDAFTGKGVLASRWDASGVRTSYDPETKELTFTAPEGWEDRTTPETREARDEAWEKIDDPTLDVVYTLRVVTAHDGSECDTKLFLVNHDDGTIELRTGITFQPLERIPPGSVVSIEVRARARAFAPREAVLLRGDITVPEEVRWLSQNTPGLLFVVGAGFTVSAHVLENKKGGAHTKTITHVSLHGRPENVGLI